MPGCKIRRQTLTRRLSQDTLLTSRIFFFVVTVSTPCILQREISRADMIAVDGTFKLVMGGFPVVVTCEVRENGLSKVRSISLVSGETEECVGEALKHSLKLSGKSNIKFDMHDAGSAVFAAAKSTLPESRHLMCWFHMRTACKKQVRVLLRGDAEKKTDRAHASSQERAALVQEMLSHIDFLHCCQSDADFTRLGELMEQNWRARGEGECMDYLHKEWLTGDCQFWYVGASRWLPSSDNHLEAHNRVLKVRLAGNPSPIPILLRNMRPYLGEVSRSLDRHEVARRFIIHTFMGRGISAYREVSCIKQQYSRSTRFFYKSTETGRKCS